jgi:hypothetical protein
MISILGNISVLAFLIFIVLSIVSAVKKNGKLRTYLIFTGVSFVLMAVLVPLDPSEPNNKTSKNKVTTTSNGNAKEASTEDSSEKKLYKQLKKAANPNFGKVTKFEVNNDYGKNDRGKIVLIHIRQDSLTKRTADYNTARVLEKLFKTNKVNEITYFWEATLVDTKGNESVDTICKIQMNKETAKSINWDNFSFTNLEKVADYYHASSVLK